jgi:hypothetical protein
MTGRSSSQASRVAWYSESMAMVMDAENSTGIV